VSERKSVYKSSAFFLKQSDLIFLNSKIQKFIVQALLKIHLSTNFPYNTIFRL